MQAEASESVAQRRTLRPLVGALTFEQHLRSRLPSEIETERIADGGLLKEPDDIRRYALGPRPANKVAADALRWGM
jgi:hypothetical protein